MVHPVPSVSVKNGVNMGNRKVIHVELLRPPQGYQKHYYFGSVAAIQSVLPREVVGVSKEVIWADMKDGEYIGRKAIIRKGELITQSTNRGNKGG